LAAVAVLAAACGGGGEEEVVQAPPETPPSTEMVTTTETIPEPTWPLTGMPLGDAAHAQAPAVAVKLDNDAKARPHAGLALADLVFEVKVEGITRFGAIFHSQAADPVGPIRSARSTDIDLLANLHRPLLVWSGGNPGVTGQVQAAQGEGLLVDTSPNVAPGNYWRQPGRPAAPHNLFANVSAFRDGFAPPDATPPGPIFAFRDDAAPPAIGDEVPGVEVAFAPGSVVRYVWDAPGGCWRRFQEGPGHVGPDSAFMDETAGQICPQNVVVLFAPYRPSEVDARSPQALTVGEGDVLVATGGKLIAGRWARPERGSAYSLTAADGSPIGLTPGRTWVAVPEQGASTAGALSLDVARPMWAWYR
jgi:hypothetical protein